MIARIAHVLLLSSVVACSGRPADFGEAPDGGADDGTSIHADMPDSGPPRAAIGAPCDGPDACVDEALCIGAADGRFVCMQRCATPYSICSDGAVCLPVMTEDAAICYTGGEAADTAPCTNNLTCAPGLLCFGSGSEHYCRAACTGPTSCDASQYCLQLGSGAGLCRSSTGAACASSSDCAAGLTCSYEIDAIANSFPGGFCTSACQNDTECRANSVCRTVPGTNTSVCMQTCEHTSDCRFNAAYECLAADACAASSDLTACQALFGEDALCVPGAF